MSSFGRPFRLHQPIHKLLYDNLVTPKRAAGYARVIYAAGNGTGRARHVNRGVAALIEQEGVDIAGSIPIPSHDLARGVDPVGLGTVRARHVERGVAALIGQETMACAAIRAPSHDLAPCVDPGGAGIGVA